MLLLWVLCRNAQRVQETEEAPVSVLGNLNKNVASGIEKTVLFHEIS